MPPRISIGVTSAARAGRQGAWPLQLYLRHLHRFACSGSRVRLGETSAGRGGRSGDSGAGHKQSCVCGVIWRARGWSEGAEFRNGGGGASAALVGCLWREEKARGLKASAGAVRAGDRFEGGNRARRRVSLTIENTTVSSLGSTQKVFDCRIAERRDDSLRNSSKRSPVFAATCIDNGVFRGLITCGHFP
jgi:hypothetical protein